jgi:transposase
MSSNRKTTPVSVIGIDIGKNSFHVVGQDQRGAIVLRQKWSRGTVEDLASDWRSLDKRIEGLSEEIEALARQDSACERLMTVPGIGPIISSAMVAAIGTGDAFSKGRDFGAWLGLVPKQISTGDRTILGGISKRGNRYLRALFVQAAWVVLVKLGPKQWERYRLKSWIEAAKKRLHHNVLAIALANKLARIAWAVLHKGRVFECVKANEMASQPA